MTKNFYPELQDEQSTQDRYVLQPYPGLKLFGSASSGVDRGMLEHQTILYKITGTTFFSVASDGVHTSKGTIAGTAQCILVGFGVGVVIANGEGRVYFYDGSTVAEITDSDLETPLTVAHLNNQAIYDGDGGRFVTSAAGDATSIDGLDFATAESNADDLIRVYTFNQSLYLYGEKTIEPWFNSGVGRPPYDRIDGGIITVGLAARMSLNNNDNFMYFLGDDRKVYRISSISQAQSVSNIALSNEFESYTTVSDAIGFNFTIQGQNFYQLNFPEEDRTWVFSESVSQWFELGDTGRELSNSHAFAYGKNLVGDFSGPNIYEMDVNTFDINGASQIRIRDTGPLHGGLLGAPGNEIELNRFELILERGVGLISGQGSDPIIILQLSIDGGRTFGTEIWEHIGKSGEFLQKVQWNGLGRASEFIARIKSSDPVPYCIHGANADIELTI
ncbi:MAG: hypothetical protein O7D95_02860 [Betaproteobacteria bacterium]|nr:hypothetical protein [Betaproteobacteria bacterium]